MPLTVYIRQNLVQYYPAEIIGNLKEIVNEIESFVFKNDNNNNNNAKEKLPFICIVNPPRHGKSLLLDKLFCDRNDVRVIEITYNSNSNIFDGEILSNATALFYFWLRVIKAVVFNKNFSLAELRNIVCGDSEINPKINYNLNWTKGILLQIFNLNPFVDSNGVTLPLLIAVDEFSKLTDAVQKKWTTQDQNFFINALQNDKKANPFVQFVFTGFNRKMSNLMGASSPNVETKTLNLCDFSSSKPLLRLIINIYKEKKIDIPMLLFETIKSTPGLIGLWAERIFHLQSFDMFFGIFRDTMEWSKFICGEAMIKENWNLCIEYLLLFEKEELVGEKKNDALLNIGDKLISNLIGVLELVKNSNVSIPLLSPFCFVAIATKVENYLVTHEEKILWSCIDASINACSTQANVVCSSSNKKDGKSFEVFVSATFKSRILLRTMLNNNNDFGIFSFKSLFPADISGILTSKLWDGSEVYIHGIASKAALQKMLTYPLYYIFPVGLEALDEIDFLNGCILTQFISSTLEQEIFLNDFKVGVKNKFFSKPISFVSSAVSSKQSLTESEWECFKNFEISSVKSSAIAVEGSESSSTETTKMKMSGSSKKKNISDVEILKNNIASTVETIKKNLDCSIFPVADCGIGCDLIMLLHEIDENGQVDENKLHIVAIELKDSRTTSKEKWSEKLIALTSFRCIVPQLKNALQKVGKTLTFHIIFAGREHSYNN
jgi:hypothetical protein